MLTFLAIMTLISIGQLLTIVVGRIDLSVGALAGFVVVLASFLTPDGVGAGEVLGGAVLILAIAAGYGLFQGWLITNIWVPAIIVTLASFIGLQGLSPAFKPKAAGAITRPLQRAGRGDASRRDLLQRCAPPPPRRALESVRPAVTRLSTESDGRGHGGALHAVKVGML